MAVEEHKHDCDVHSFKMEEHEKRLNKIDEILDKVRNRPPVWVTAVLGVLVTPVSVATKLKRIYP